MVEFNELDEKNELVLPRGNPVELSALGPFDVSPEDADAFAEKERILSYVREEYTNRFGEKISEGGAQDEWAMVVGRFQPLQPGHGLLFDAAAIAAKNLLVVVGSANKIDAKNPFPPEDRELMIRKYLQEKGFAGQLEIVYQDDLYQDRTGKTNFPWGDQVLKKVQKGKEIDVVISNEESKWINGIFRSRGKKVFEVPMFNRRENVSTAKRTKLTEEGILQPGVNRIKH